MKTDTALRWLLASALGLGASACADDDSIKYGLGSATLRVSPEGEVEAESYSITAKGDGSAKLTLDVVFSATADDFASFPSPLTAYLTLQGSALDAATATSVQIPLFRGEGSFEGTTVVTTKVPGGLRVMAKVLDIEAIADIEVEARPAPSLAWMDTAPLCFTRGASATEVFSIVVKVVAPKGLLPSTVAWVATEPGVAMSPTSEVGDAGQNEDGDDVGLTTMMVFAPGGTLAETQAFSVTASARGASLSRVVAPCT